MVGGARDLGELVEVRREQRPAADAIVVVSTVSGQPVGSCSTFVVGRDTPAALATDHPCPPWNAIHPRALGIDGWYATRGPEWLANPVH